MRPDPHDIITMSWPGDEPKHIGDKLIKVTNVRAISDKPHNDAVRVKEVKIKGSVLNNLDFLFHSLKV